MRARGRGRGHPLIPALVSLVGFVSGGDNGGHRDPSSAFQEEQVQDEEEGQEGGCGEQGYYTRLAEPLVLRLGRSLRMHTG